MKIIMIVTDIFLWLCACITTAVAIWMLSQCYFLLGSIFLFTSVSFVYFYFVSKGRDES